jgi:hypothetical protein
VMRRREPKIEIEQEMMIGIGSWVDWRYVGGHVESIAVERFCVSMGTLVRSVEPGERRMREIISKDRMLLVNNLKIWSAGLRSIRRVEMAHPYNRIVNLKKSA